MIFNVDGFYKDKDFKIEFNKKTLENIIKNDLLDRRLYGLLTECLEGALLNDDEKKLLQITIIGGSLRIPVLKDVILEFLEKINGKTSLRQTLNMDECIGLGCSYYYEMRNGKWKYEIDDKKCYLKDTYYVNCIEDDDIKKAYEIEYSMEENDNLYSLLSNYRKRANSE